MKFTPQQRAGIEPKTLPVRGKKRKFRPIAVTGKLKGFAEGGFVEGLKKAVGMGPKESLMEKTQREMAQKKAAPEPPKEATKTPEAGGSSSRAKQINAAVEGAGG